MLSIGKCTCRSLGPSRLIRTVHSIASNSNSIPSKKGKEVDRWSGWIPTIGLELHVQLRGNVKLFSSALAGYEASPNSHIALFDSALPGSLPVSWSPHVAHYSELYLSATNLFKKLGTEPVRLALLACLALKSDINPNSTFDRKHYFYPDLPAGFQVTQKYSPLATGGKVKVRRDKGINSEAFDVRINQIQLEQDTAKSSHDPDTNLTQVDLNRAGAALIEIVTEPDMSSPDDAVAFVKHLQSLLRHIGSSDANMDRGEFRCDVNVSVRRSTAAITDLGTRCEVKNLNGLRSLVGAIESEIRRQVKDLESNIPIVQATRGYDVMSGETFHLRSKEDAPDYRYMPDPELGPILFTSDQIQSLLSTLPELPEDTFDRLQSQYNLTAKDASILVALGEGESNDINGSNGAGLGVNFFEQVAKGRDGKIAGNWVIHELLGQLAKVDLTLGQSPVSASEMGILIDAVVKGTLTGTSAKSILKSLISPSSSSSPSTSLSQLIASQSSSIPSSDDITIICSKVIIDLSIEAEKVKGGQEKILMRLVGEVMKRSKGKADAKKVVIILKELLGV